MHGLSNWATQYWLDMVYNEPTWQGLFVTLGLIIVLVGAFVLAIVSCASYFDKNFSMAHKALMAVEGVLFLSVVSYLLGGWSFVGIVLGCGLWSVAGLIVISLCAKMIYDVQVKPLVTRLGARRNVIRNTKETQFPGTR